MLPTMVPRSGSTPHRLPAILFVLRIALLAVGLGFCATVAAYAQHGSELPVETARSRPSTLGPRLAGCWNDLAADGSIPVWVEFLGRGAATPVSRTDVVTPRSLQRRARVLPAPYLDTDDLPPAAANVDAVRRCGVRIRQRSRWLNAVTVLATPRQILALAELPCVRSIELVARSRRDPAAGRRGRGAAIDGPGYGDAAAQLQVVRADVLHDRGLYGLGVIVAHFDTGYERLSHEAFRTLRIAATWDFVDGDVDVGHAISLPGDPLDHGHQTLSVLAGFAPGKLVGVAPGATLLLARTESALEEAPYEEDLWIAALEWADSLGADIVSSSLKFLDYDLPYTGHTWQDMDGFSTRVTRAADMAARRGIAVFNGAGNEGPSYDHNTLVAPADGNEVLAIGAVNFAGTRASFSSVGPTVDGRIKPDLMAPGVQVVAADVVNDSSYTRVSGTSLATPIAAGVAALLLSVHAATPTELRDVLCSTASAAVAPDNWMGYGVIDAFAAYQALVRRYPTAVGPDAIRPVALAFANPFRPGGDIAWRFLAESPATVRIYDVLGRRVRVLAPAHGMRATWDGTDDAGRPLASGTYFVELRAPHGSTARAKLVLVH